MGRQPRDPKEIAAIQRAISDALPPARKARGLTQQEIAELIDVSVEFYRRLERGRALPSIETLIAMADTLEISVDSMLPDLRPKPIEHETTPAIDYIVQRCREDRTTMRLVKLVLTVFEQAEKRRS